MKRTCVLCGIVLFLCPGCLGLGAAKRGFKELRGATGKAVPVRACSAGFCASVGTIELGSVTNSIAPVCPPEMFALIKASLTWHAAQASEELDGAGTAVLDVDITFHKKPGGVLAVAGKEGLLIGRAVVKDEAGRQQGDLLIAVSSEAVRTTEEEMAEVFAKTLIGYVEERAGRED